MDPHSRVHFVRVPERSEMQQVEGSSDSDAEDTKESAARRIGEQKSGTASVPTNASKYAAAAGAVSQVKPEISTATVKTEVTDGNSSAGDTAEVKTEAVNGGLSSGGAAAATTSEPQIVSSGEHTAESVSKEGDGADATAGTPEKPPPAENKVRMQTVFYRRLPKVRSPSCGRICVIVTLNPSVLFFSGIQRRSVDAVGQGGIGTVADLSQRALPPRNDSE